MDDLPQTRPSLLLRLQGTRDELAWSEFLAIYEPLILRLMRLRGLQDSDARDATQQVLMRISSAISRYEPDGAEASFRRWLSKVARNVVVTFLTKREKWPTSFDEHALDGLQVSSANRGEDSELFDREYQKQVLAWALQHVRSEFRESTWLAFVETCINGRPIAEVAKELEMSPGSVYVSRSRLMARLRTKVEEFEALS